MKNSGVCLCVSGYYSYHLLAVLFVALATRLGRAGTAGTGRGLERR